MVGVKGRSMSRASFLGRLGGVVDIGGLFRRGPRFSSRVCRTLKFGRGGIRRFRKF